MSDSRPIPDQRDSRFDQSGTIYYFGCWGDTGHFLWTPQRERLPYHDRIERQPPRTPWEGQLDGGLPPRPNGRYSEAPNGVAALHHKDGWTALAFWDNSVDGRGNSHSTFLIEGTYDFDSALERAREAFPRIFRRYSFDVVPFEGAKAA